ncbi:hypothetical protein MMC13_007531 [Lambiella insularis]|nr:hypothetical protein [Lambiella insularis]
MLSDEEEQKLFELWQSSRYGEFDDDDLDGDVEPTLFSVAEDLYTKPGCWTNIGGPLSNIDMFKLGPAAHRARKSARKHAATPVVGRQRMLDFYAQDKAWILRNLTTHEYVRSEAIALSPKYIHGPHIEHLGFGGVVLSRICFSSDSSGSRRPGMTRGVWTGHRFDITTFERHEQSVQGDAVWKDISEKVGKETLELWKNEYHGHCWPEILQDVPSLTQEVE